MKWLDCQSVIKTVFLIRWVTENKDGQQPETITDTNGVLKMFNFWCGFIIGGLGVYLWHLGDSVEQAKQDREYEREIIRKQIEKRGKL